MFGLGGLVHRLLGEHKLDLVPHHIGDTNLRESCTRSVLSHLESVNEAGRRVLGQLGLVEAVGVMDDGCLEARGAPRETGPRRLVGWSCGRGETGGWGGGGGSQAWYT